MNKPLVTLTLLAVAPFFLTGCALKKSSTSTVAKETLVVWRQPVNKAADEQAFNQIIAAFEKKNPAVKVNYRVFAATDDFETTVLNALAAGQGPDVWEIRNDELARHQDKLVSFPSKTPLNLDKFKKSYAPVIADEMIDNGQLFGMPLGLDPLVLFANTNHLQSIQLETPPKTWQDVIRVGNILTRKVGGDIFRPGFALGTVSNLDRASQIIELLMLQFNTQMVDPAHKTATFDLYTQDAAGPQFDYPSQKALGLFVSFAHAESGYQTWDINQPYSTKAFANGNLSMMINYLSTGAQLRVLNPKLQFKVGPAPQIVSKTYPTEDIPGNVSNPVYTARYQALVVSKPWVKLSAKQQEVKRQLGWQFISFATSAGAVATYDQANWLLRSQLPTTDTTSDQTDQPSNPIAPYIVSWYKGHSPRLVDKVLSEMTGVIAEQNAPLQETIHAAAQAVTSLLP